MIKTFSDVETVDALQRAGFSELEKQFLEVVDTAATDPSETAGNHFSSYFSQVIFSFLV